MKYWNKCLIKRIESTTHIPGIAENLIVDFLDFKPHFRFNIFAQSCGKFEDASGHFDFQRFKSGTEIIIRISGHLRMSKTENPADDNRYMNEGFITMINTQGTDTYFVMGHVIEENPEDYEVERGRVMKANNLYIYYIDNKNITKKGDNVLISLYGIVDLRE